jgi:hypothetical protein
MFSVPPSEIVEQPHQAQLIAQEPGDRIAR